MAIDSSPKIDVASFGGASELQMRAFSTASPSALDRKSRGIQVFVWLAFLSAVLLAGLWVHGRMGPRVVDEASWSIESPGVLALDGKPTLDLSSDSRGPFAKLTTKKGVQLHRLDDTMGFGTRAFWRGSSLILDNGEGEVVRIDPKLNLVLPASAQYGWRSESTPRT